MNNNISINPSFILEGYLNATALAVLRVAEAVENLKGREALSPQEAAYLSVAMYGAPPKPSAGNVAAVVKQGIADKELSDDVLLKMSVARRGQETNSARANIAADDICTIMEDVTGKGFKYSNQRALADENNRVHIGMLNDTTPIIACGRYKMHTGNNPPAVTVEAIQNQATISAVENNFNEIFKDVQNNQQQQQNQSFVTTVANNVNLGALVAWADSVEKAIRSPNNISPSTAAVTTPAPALATGPSRVVDEITSRNSSVAKTAVQTIYSLVGSSYCRTVTQLTSAQDILRFKKAADTCFEALMTDTRERAIVNFLFYVNFKVVEGDSEREFVKQRLASMAGNRKPLVIARRTAEEMLFGTCFLFKVMPREFVACILNFPTMSLSSHHGLSGTCLAPLLNNYGPSFDNSWSLFNQVLQQRSKAVKSLCGKLNRVDTRDSSSNLTGPVYVLVLDLARTLTHQRTCSKNFLDKITEQYLLWNKFVEGK